MEEEKREEEKRNKYIETKRVAFMKVVNGALENLTGNTVGVGGILEKIIVKSAGLGYELDAAKDDKRYVSKEDLKTLNGMVTEFVKEVHVGGNVEFDREAEAMLNDDWNSDNE